MSGACDEHQRDSCRAPGPTPGALPCLRITRDIPGVAPPGYTTVERETGRRLISPGLGELEAAVAEQGQSATPGGCQLKLPGKMLFVGNRFDLYAKTLRVSPYFTTIRSRG